MRAPLRLLLLALLCVACGDGSEPAPGVAPRDRAQLKALGYAGWAKEDQASLDRRGVTHYEPSRVSPGVRYYCSEPGDTVHFIEPDGRELHTVPVPVAHPFYPDNRCKLVVPYDQHHLLVLHERTQLSMVDLEGRVVWRVRGLFHHDVDRDSAGRIYALRDRPAVVPSIHPSRRIFDVDIVVFSPDGVELRSVPLSTLLETRTSTRLRAAFRAWWVTFGDWRKHKADRTLDLFHANTIHVIRRAGPLPGGEERHPGDLLLCVRNLNLILIVDLAHEHIRWVWGPGELDRPHHPSELPNGDLMVFDNGRHRGWSRVVEVDPVRKAVVWQYRADPPQAFYSRTRGSAQALPGGNVLVTQSDSGRVFEITRGGDIVWEFWNPARDQINHRRATIYRMLQLAPGALDLPGVPPTNG